MAMELQPKAIHDEMNSTAFDEFGRMTANLGIEAKPPTPAAQNVTLYPYTNPQTELIDATNLPKNVVVYDADGLPVSDVTIQSISSADDGSQIWRITHNGVDTHPIHFHLYDVQVLNRVTWDNIIIPPDPKELGWKDTVRISPLEDTIVALRPIIPELPWELPNSVRPLNPMMMLGFTNPDPAFPNIPFNNVDPQGNPTAPIVNQLVNFGWEYVYHCHILSHEEMDMMRPVSVAMPPRAPDSLSFDSATKTLTFQDNSIAETSFLVQRSLDGTTWTDVPDPTGAMVSPLDQPNLPGPRSLVDPAFDPAIPTSYRVVAQNSVGYGGAFPAMVVTSVSNTLIVGDLTPTTTTVDGAPNTSTYGQSVTFTATVSPATGTVTPTGTVQFSVNGTNVGAPVALVSGVATYTTSTLAAGSQTVAATYSGSAQFEASTGSMTQTVDPAASTTTLTSSKNPSSLGQAVTLTATVTPAAATGTVTFTVDGVAGSPVTLVAGKATLTTSTLTAGSHPIVATYSGDANFSGSTATMTQIVDPVAASTTAVTSSLNPSVYGQAVTLTATVTPAAATGTVTFTVDGVAGSPVTLVAGKATLTTSTLTAGSHPIVATYSGDANFSGSTGSLTQTVNKAATTTTASTSDNNGRVNNQIQLRATVAVVAPGAGIRTGTVTFTLSNSKVIGSAVVATNGTATLNWTPTPADVGTWTVTATYSGDPNFVGSFGTIKNQRVR